jgi:hypothetical protein
MSDIADQIAPHSILLCNESFASTNEREGSEIAGQVVRAMLDKHIRVFFVTHMYELADSFHAQQLDTALFLRAERDPDGRRTFTLLEREPLRTSYGEDSYRRVFSAPADRVSPVLARGRVRRSARLTASTARRRKPDLARQDLDSRGTRRARFEVLKLGAPGAEIVWSSSLAGATEAA